MVSLTKECQGLNSQKIGNPVMRASEAGAALALQPENDGERTALSRLREIYRRATAYRLPCPYWDEEPGRYCDLNPTGADIVEASA